MSFNTKKSPKIWPTGIGKGFMMYISPITQNYFKISHFMPIGRGSTSSLHAVGWGGAK